MLRFATVLFFASIYGIDGFSMKSAQTKNIEMAPIHFFSRYRLFDSTTSSSSVLSRSSSHVLQGTARNLVGDLLRSTKRITTTLWDFSRPHTVLGTTASALSLFCYATPPKLWASKLFLKSVTEALVPALLTNIYITGLNQIIDVDIDRINKPYLPIASGEMSKSVAIVTVLSSLLGSFMLSKSSEAPLRVMLSLATLLGTVYSLPPFGFKRFVVVGALCIIVV